ncbi:metallophosphoesterase [Flagellimonas sp.]|uniref:metallophosphoesterase n=1 Tax=Flagellimonas sp. TaxID=2058762 RepID=UPI003C7C4878
MSTYLISDIHGHNKTFRKALKKVALKKTDTLIILGDIIDRGPDSKGVLDTIFLLKDHGFDVKCLKGNHEQLFIDSFDDTYSKVSWIRNGGNLTLQSFLTSDIEGIPKKYIDFIKTFEDYILIENYILVHAGIDMTKKDPLEDKHSLFWLRDWQSVYDKVWLGDRTVIHGHTPMPETEIVQQFDSEVSNVICIDAGIYLLKEKGYGKLCIMNLDRKTLDFQNKLEK